MPNGICRPHPFVLSFNNTGRGPNESSLPFQNAGYAINNNLNSFALELNSRSSSFANRFFASYNRFRDHRTPFSVNFPTIEIGEAGVTYTTVGHEPFSIHNILDQDVWQFTNNFTWFQGRHSITVGGELRAVQLLQLVQHLPERGLLPAGAADQHRHSRSRRWTSSSPRPIRATPTRSISRPSIGTGPVQGRRHRT